MKKRSFTPSEKAAVALAALRADATIPVVSSRFDVHPSQVKRWSAHAKENLAGLFADNARLVERQHEQTINELHRIIGQRDVELEWVKKKMRTMDSP